MPDLTTAYADVCALARSSWPDAARVTLAGIRPVAWARAKRPKTLRRAGEVRVLASHPYCDPDDGKLLGRVLVFKVEAA